MLALRFTMVRESIARKASSYLSDKLATHISVKGFDLGLIHTINLHEVYAEDKKGDTLLYAQKISADLDLGALLKNRVQLDRVSLDGVRGVVYRNYPDTNYNYSFIVTAFAGNKPDTAVVDTTASGWLFGIGEVSIDNTRLVYFDDFSGVDLSANIGKLSCVFKEFNLDGSTIIAKAISLDKSNILYKQHSAKDTVESPSGPTPAWLFGSEKIEINKTSAFFIDADSSLYGADVGRFLVNDGKINLGTSRIDVNKVMLSNADAKVVMMPARSASALASSPVAQDTSAPWKINVKNIALSDNTVHFEIKGKAPVEGFNPALMRISDLSLNASSFVMNGEDISAKVTDLSLNEKNGFSVSRLAGDFHYDNKGAWARKLVVITPYSRISREFSVSYASLDEMSSHPDRAVLFADVRRSAVGLRDVYYFVPSLAQTLKMGPGEKIYVDANVSGTLAKMKTDLAFTWRTSKVKIKGELRELMNPQSFYADLPVISVRSGEADIAAMIPAGTLPPRFHLPDSLALDANFLGFSRNFNSSLELRSSLGHMKADVVMDPSRGNMAVPYAGTVITEGLSLGHILSRSDLGELTFSVALKGSGMDTATFDTDLSLNVERFEYNKYLYKDLILNGHLLKSAFEGNASMRDDNLAFDFDGLVNIDPTAPRFRCTLDLKGVDFKSLHLSEDDLRLSFLMKANIMLPSNENPVGTAGIYKLLVMREGKKHRADSLVVDASETGGVTTIALRGDKLNGEAKGAFNLTAVVPSMISYINSHFDLDPAHKDTVVAEQQVAFNLKLTDPGFLTTGLVPGLQRLLPAELKGSFDSRARQLSAKIDMPEIVYNGIRMDSLKIDVNGDANGIKYKTSLSEVTDTVNFKFENMSLQGLAAGNRLDFNFRTAKDDSVKVLALGGKIYSGDSVFSLRLDKQAILNAEKWSVDSNNRVTFGSLPLRVFDLVMSNGNQLISLSHESRAPQSPLTTKFKDFELLTISGLLNHSKPLVSGKVNGELILEEKNGRGAFKSDLTIASLAYKTNPIGNVSAKADNLSDPAVYETNLSISGGDNDVKIDGAFRTNAKNSLDFNIRIGKLNVGAIEPFTGGEVTRLGGWISANLKLGGNPEGPKLDGNMQLHDVAFRPRMLDVLYRIPSGELAFAADRIRFNNFTLLDSLNNKATVTGFVNVDNLSDPSFDLKLHTKDFIAMSTDKYDNSLYYGKIYLDSDVHLTGSVNSPNVDVNAKLGKKTTLTYVKPADAIIKNESQGIVEFSDTLGKYTKIMTRDDSARVKGIVGLDLNADITVDEQVELKVIVDPLAGDSLYIQGGGRLNFSMDRGGNTSLSGKYNMTKGGYYLTISDFVKRSFQIEPGSSVSWSGDPLDPYAELKAVYKLKASPIDLMQEQVAGLNEIDAKKYRKLLNFDVYLIMTGFISSPEISFDIQLAPKDRGAMGGEVNNKLAQLRTDENQLNKQVFALLTLRRFVSENPLESSGGSDFASAGRSSASKILTDQLNQLSDRYVNFVDLDFGVNSYEDYSSGKQEGRTQVDVGVSKQFFNDRVGIRVGTSVDVEGEDASKNKASSMAGNISVDYSLTEDKRYRVRGFRETQYENPLDGEVTKTGVGFVFTRDFNRFRNMFRKPHSHSNGEKKNK